MIVATPPMGWNSWNTFASNINEELIYQMADKMVEDGYLEAGYEYLVIDDCWSLKERGTNGRMIPDPDKFPNGMKAVADYVHSKGLKFGMYSCAGVRTCCGFPGSYDYEFLDARTFAEWGVDYLKYDFCNFPESGDCKARYATMSLALRSTGRDIVFAACNWGRQDPGTWMKAIGAHTYRSETDIMDNYQSFTEIFRKQLDKLHLSSQYCFNDLDMLTVGMSGDGYASLGKTCTKEEYRLQFSLWCMVGSPLMMGADLRKLLPEYKELLQNKTLLRINQDAECRPPYIVRRGGVRTPDNENPLHPWKYPANTALVLMRYLTNSEIALMYINLADADGEIHSEFIDFGLSINSQVALNMTDVFTGEQFASVRNCFNPLVKAHDCKLYMCRLKYMDS